MAELKINIEDTAAAQERLEATLREAMEPLKACLTGALEAATRYVTERVTDVLALTGRAECERKLAAAARKATVTTLMAPAEGGTERPTAAVSFDSHADALNFYFALGALRKAA